MVNSVVKPTITRKNMVSFVVKLTTDAKPARQAGVFALFRKWITQTRSYRRTIFPRRFLSNRILQDGLRATTFSAGLHQKSTLVHLRHLISLSNFT